MYKKVQEIKQMQIIGDYTIIKSTEQMYLEDGRRFGRESIWYDICLDGGEGDMVASFKKLNDARKWVRS